ncbi:MAG: hypothetical protein WD928_02725 [Gammaproteobacteria bacterium]
MTFYGPASAGHSLMDTNIVHQAITDALSASLAPYVATLEARLAAVEERIASNVPRRHITDGTKQRHRAVVAALGGRIHYTAAFQAYQQRAVQIKAGQMALFG